ncbi:MAG TPA: hypothetical protein VEY71_06170 [Chitinophagales bacterium]|nr:hypothetical protein [Chitinophagales bacterium]
MRASRLLVNGLVGIALLFGACKKDVLQKRVYDNVLYEVNPVTLYATNANKTKQKTSLQFISILYTDLFNTSIPASKLNAMSEVTLSIGDKSIASNMILQKLLVEPGVQVPTNQEMRDNLDQFVADTYVRFYLRHPTPYEAHHVKKLIQDDAALTPEMVYAAFTQSNEYFFY